MSNRRDLSLDKYQISRDVYRELLYFCRQYPAKKDALNDLRSLSSTPITGMPRGQTVGNPTERKATAAAKLSADCELVEQTAIEANAEVYTWLIKNVTEESAPYEWIGPPIGRRQFYESRRRFFYLLAYKKSMIY